MDLIERSRVSRSAPSCQLEALEPRALLCAVSFPQTDLIETSPLPDPALMAEIDAAAGATAQANATQAAMKGALSGIPAFNTRMPPRLRFAG
jgi:hypothetical protein